MGNQDVILSYLDELLTPIESSVGCVVPDNSIPKERALEMLNKRPRNAQERFNAGLLTLSLCRTLSYGKLHSSLMTCARRWLSLS